MLSKILVPVEFSGMCQGAARYAEALAAFFNAEMTLAHVVMPVIAYGSPEALAYSTVGELAAERRTLAKTHLEMFLADGLEGIPRIRVVLEGDPATRIVEYAYKGNFDLIVMPTHGYGPFRRFLLGSVTAKVLHDAGCPVWTGPHMEGAPDYPRISFRRVLCAIDLGPHSASVLDWAAKFAREYGADLDIVHAIPTSTVSVGGFYFDPEWRVQVENEARDRIAYLRQDLGIKGEVRVETGEVATAVRAVAEDSHADLVVVGRTHGGVLGRLRANAYAIIRDSPCPVTAV